MGREIGGKSEKAAESSLKGEEEKKKMETQGHAKMERKT